MADDESEAARAALAALIAERREDYAGLSRLLGRNPAYIQQYVKRGSPRRLSPADRKRLADYFDVPEARLGAPATTDPRIATAGEGTRGADLVAVPRLALAASAGPGALDPAERRVADLHFTPAMLRALGVASFAELGLIRVAGDSMLPTLADGDDILVDRADAADRLREGVYVLRVDEALMVKRIALGPAGAVSVLSDNRRHKSWPDADRRTLQIVGRVVWAGRKVR
jgi:phage repressor protein C with HTH and peptisase S24 domain